MFVAPPDQSFEWSDEGVRGSYRFLNRIWNLVQNHISLGQISKPDFSSPNEKTLNLRQKTHKTLFKVKDDFSRRHSFNTAISSIMELTNAIPKEFLTKKATLKERSATNEAINNILIMLSPITPHITHYLWRKMGNRQAIIDVEWPETDKKLLEDQTINFVIQINGKLRANIILDKESTNKKIEEMALQNKNIKKHLSKKGVKKFIHVKDKLLNIVTS